MEERKLFFEVFPDLEIKSLVNGEILSELFSQVEVEKITSNREKQNINIFIYSKKLIEKHDIQVMERAIENQLFSNTLISVNIIARFDLSNQYTPKNLYDAYRVSILSELKDTSIIMYNIFKKGNVSFDDNNRMLLDVEDTMLNREKLSTLKKLLEKIFCERCGVAINVEFNMIEAKLNKFAKQNEIITNNEIAEISKKLAEIDEENEKKETILKAKEAKKNGNSGDENSSGKKQIDGSMNETSRGGKEAEKNGGKSEAIKENSNGNSYGGKGYN